MAMALPISISPQKLISTAPDGRLATVTAVRPQARFGTMTINNNRVLTFEEKPKTEGGWINGGYFLSLSQNRQFAHRRRDYLGA